MLKLRKINKKSKKILKNMYLKYFCQLFFLLDTKLEL